METPEYFHGGYLRTGFPQYSPEMKASGGAGEFIVEDLLDFSNEEEEEAGGVLISGDEGGLRDTAVWNSTARSDESAATAVDSFVNSFGGGDAHFPGNVLCRSFADASLSGNICEPHYDEIKELEWLSNFVEETSFASDDPHKLHVNAGAATAAAAPFKTAVTSALPPDDASQPHAFRPEAPIPGKARGKRSRAAPCSWASRLLVLPSSIQRPSSPESELFNPPVPPQEDAHAVKKAAKSGKEKDPSGRTATTWEGRKCSHCQTDKTPQWRTGPMGPKTLCNACGVRYKSGRLVPEYRPAASPTFVLSKHSNSHRKVLELRRQKELVLQQQQQLPGSAAVDSGLSDAPSSMHVAGNNFLIRRGFGPDFRQMI